jgi:hypothetical protein
MLPEVRLSIVLPATAVLPGVVLWLVLPATDVLPEVRLAIVAPPTAVLPEVVLSIFAPATGVLPEVVRWIVVIRREQSPAHAPPRYALMTSGCRQMSCGDPSAILRPKFNTTTRSEILMTRPM